VFSSALRLGFGRWRALLRGVTLGLPISRWASKLGPASRAMRSGMQGSSLVPKRGLVVVVYCTIPRPVGPIPVGTAVEPRRIVELILGNADSIAA